MEKENAPLVAIFRDENIKRATKKVMETLHLPDLTGKRILLKPNVGRQLENPIGINTNPKVVEGIFEYLKEHFEAEIFIGDSPIIGVKTRTAFSLSGYDALLKQKGITFIDLDDKTPLTVNLNGKILSTIKLSGYFREFDYVISIPVLKMHMHTGASLSFKNCKGLIYKREKIKLHHLEAPDLINQLPIKAKELDVAISDLAEVIQPHLAVIDASYAQEGMGPSDGTPVKLNTIIASTDFLAADRTAIYITQPSWTFKDVPHLWLIAEKLKWKWDIKDFIFNDDIEKFKRPIAPPPKSVSMKYKYVKVYDKESCSACLSTVFLFLKNNKEFLREHFSKENPLSLAIGRGLKNEEFKHPTFLIGNCTANRRKDGIFIKGCTPVQSVILKRVKEFLEEKENSDKNNDE